MTHITLHDDHAMTITAITTPQARERMNRRW